MNAVQLIIVEFAPEDSHLVIIRLGNVLGIDRRDRLMGHNDIDIDPETDEDKNDDSDK
jgi:hypothetical protein